jgi:hypothetical protein
LLVEEDDVRRLTGEGETASFGDTEEEW